MTVALVLFGIAALGGLLLAGIRFSGQPYPPLVLAFVHGLLAASGLVALILAITQVGTPDLAKVSLVVFLLAAAGGFALISKHLRKLALPKALVIAHGLAAVVAFILLLIARF